MILASLSTRARPLSQVHAEALALAAALMLGLGLVWAAGFASAASIHDAAHDQRHAVGFPCH